MEYASGTRTARMQAVADDIDGGTGAGKIKIRDSSNTVLVTFTLTDPCGTVSGDDLIFDCDPDLTAYASAGGTADNAIITDSDDNTIVSGLTVGTSGTDVIVGSTTILYNQLMTLSTAQISHG